MHHFRSGIPAWPAGHGGVICWTRIQAEAGQALDAIISRKEVERRAGRGLFLWGVGNAPGSLPPKLAAEEIRPDVIFSVMKTAPKARDARPTAIVAWRGYMGADGTERPLPAHALVTSRDKAQAGCRRHYALFCSSEAPLRLDGQDAFNPADYRNLGGTGAPVGASQVTALLRRVAKSDVAVYRINMQAQMDSDMWVKLTDPVPLSPTQAAALDRVTATTGGDEWLDLVARIRDSGPPGTSARPRQPRLL